MLEEKIYKHCIAHIRRHAMDSLEWHMTLLAAAHNNVAEKIHLRANEKPIVSFFEDENNWNLLTNIAVYSRCNGVYHEFDPRTVNAVSFGDFKMHEHEIKKGSISFKNEPQPLDFKYEAGKSSMACIYYFRWWKEKYPIIDN